MTNSKKFFVPDAVFVVDQFDQDQVLKVIYDKLLELGYVKGDSYPTLLKESITFQQD